MKIPGLISFFILSFLSLHAQQATFEWASQCNNPPNTTDTKTVLSTGSEGCFYLAGEFADTADFGDQILVSEGGTDICLVRYTSEGQPEWAVRIGAEDYDYVQCIGTSSEGNVYVAGYFYGNTLIGTDAYTSYGSQDVFLASFDGSGNFLWSTRFGGISADYVMAMEISPDDDLITEINPGDVYPCTSS